MFYCFSPCWMSRQSVSNPCVPLQSHKKAGVMWREAGLRWRDFLPEDEDVNKFVTEKVGGSSQFWRNET